MPEKSKLLTELRESCGFPAGSGALHCAVSGGADSLALLALACSTGRDVTAIHVDHRLRPGSETEGEVVRVAARCFGAEFVQERVEVGKGPNLEARARAVRYSVLPEDVLTGHTADDQAETMLLNLLRGAGLDGMGGMRPERRPLLGIRRSQTRALCSDLGLSPVQDPTNASSEFSRNRVRHELLPLMNDIARRDVVPVMVNQSKSLQAVADLVDAFVVEIDPTDAKALRDADEVIASRAVRSWLRSVIDEEHHPPDRKTVERVLAVAAGRAKATEVGKGVRVSRTNQRLSLSKRGNDAG